MAYIVGDACIRCKYVSVCPVDDCFRVGANFLVIDPETCIDCTLCVPECPAEAIFAEKDVPAEQVGFIALNAELAKSWPGINDAIEPLDDADDWVDVENKLQYLER